MAKRGAAVLEMPEPGYASENGGRARGAAGRMRRDSVEDFAGEYEAEPERRRAPPRQAPTIKLRLGTGIRLPRSTAGMIATGVALLLLLGAVFWLLAVTRTFLLHDARFRIANAAAIEFEGNRHLTRAQLLDVFREDIERNIFGVSLEQRQADLEALPWVRRATLMRLLPGRLRVSVVERTPVAFVRQGGKIGLVDAHGVLLDMDLGARTEHYAFPVVTGIAAGDPASTRAARMKIFEQFTSDLDAGGAKNTESLSEIDLSNPEDVKALVEERGATVLVHFGEGEFLERYEKVKTLLPQWHAQYPNLASADMRYEHEIPLAMAAPVKAAPPAAVAARPVPKASVPVAGHPAVVPKAVTKAPVKPLPEPVLKVPVHPAGQTFVPAPVVKPWQPTAAVVPPAAAAKDAPSVSAAARSAYAAQSTKGAASQPKPVSSAASKPSAANRAGGIAAKPQIPFGNDKQSEAPQAVNHAKPHGKPSAGKPLVPDSSHPQQAVQP